MLHNAAIFRRMGCYSLALALVRRWSFIRPDIKRHPSRPTMPPAMVSGMFKEPAVTDAVDMDDPASKQTVKKPAQMAMGIQSDARQGNAEFDIGAFF